MKLKINEICLYSILGVILFALKFAMSSLPNIEPVSLLLIIYATVFGIKTLYPLMVYVALEILIYGFGFWSIAYFYIWPILVIVTIVIFKITNNNMSPLLWAFISGMFGLVFGALYIPLYAISGDWTFAMTWWISGIPYDVLHCVGNFILCITLFSPITKTLLKLKANNKYI